MSRYALSRSILAYLLLVVTVGCFLLAGGFFASAVCSGDWSTFEPCRLLPFSWALGTGDFMGMVLFVIYLPILMASIVVASLIFWAWRILGRFEISHSYERRIVSVGGSLSLAGIIMLALSGLLLFTRVFGL